MVAVEDRTRVVGADQAVGVAVQREAQVRPVLDDRGRDHLRVRRPAAQVDVRAVGDRVDRGDPRAQPPQHGRGDVRGRSVGAVHDHRQAPQVQPAGARNEVCGVGLDRAGRVALAADAHAGRAVVVVALQQLLDPVLLGVGELVAGRPDDLDPVVGDRVVAGGDHHPGAGAQRLGQVGDAGGGDDVEDHRVAAGRADPRRDRGLEHLPGRARIAPHEDARARGALLAQRAHERAPETHGELGCQLGVGDPPHPIGAEQLAHVAGAPAATASSTAAPCEPS